MRHYVPSCFVLWALGVLSAPAKKTERPYPNEISFCTTTEQVNFKFRFAKQQNYVHERMFILFFFSLYFTSIFPTASSFSFSC
jgi:hypothetical protein